MNKSRISRGAIAVVVLNLALAAAAWAQNVAITKVWPEKIAYKPGETAKITVDLENRTKADVTASVSLAVNYGLVDHDELPAQPVTLAASGKATVAFSYPIPQGRKWGHEAAATVKDAGGKELAKGREYFTVGDNPWEIGHYITAFQIRDTKKNKQIDNSMIPNYRRGYVTTIEGYSWAPSCFDCMTPAADQWRSGQGWYKEGKEDWQYLIQRAHENGMAVVTYIMRFAYGPVGFDFARRHPDWLTYDKNGRPAGAFFDLALLTAEREKPEEQKCDTAGGILTGGFLITKPEVGDYWIEELTRSVKMFGWDGFRSDGTPSIVEGYDYTGAMQKVPDLGAANTAFVKKARQKLTERFPHFLFGWNNVAGGYPQMYNSAGEESVMLKNAYSLYEFFRGASEPSSPYHAWKKAVFYLQQENMAVREGGGFLHAGWMSSPRYLEAIASASGVQIDGWGKAPHFPNYRRFEFRWSEFIWDNQLRYVRPGEPAVKVEAPARVWWQDFVQSSDLPDGRRRVTVHLINMPANDDEAWADRPPEPVAGVRVSFIAPAGKKLDRMLALSPDGTEDVIAAQPDAQGTITLPELKLWAFVVAEFK